MATMGLKVTRSVRVAGASNNVRIVLTHNGQWHVVHLAAARSFGGRMPRMPRKGQYLYANLGVVRSWPVGYMPAFVAGNTQAH